MNDIRMKSVEYCILCGAEGERMYSGLHDKLLTVEGAFGHRRCNRCELLWMDPQPIEEDIGKCYEEYFTHIEEPPYVSQVETSIIQRLKNAIRTNILCGHYGYKHLHQRHIFCGAGTFLRHIPIMGAAAAYGWGNLMPHYDDVRESLVVDIGPGRGEYIEKLRRLGCNAIGVESDKMTCAMLKKKGVPVVSATLESACLASESVAFISMQHVIEHLPDSLRTIDECYRVLKPGGKLVVRTPNCISLGHKVFGSDWFALEAPRHLYIFSPRSIRLLSKKSRFMTCHVKTLCSTAKTIYDDSLIITKCKSLHGITITPQSGRHWFAFREHMLMAMGMPYGEELEAVLTKGLHG